jgi:hypothetical protein
VVFVELAAAIAAFILELTVHLVAAILSAAYFARHRRGVQRTCAIAALCFGLYLLVALLRGFVPSLNMPQLADFFSWPLAIIAVIGLLLTITVPFAVSNPHKTPEAGQSALTAFSDEPIATEKPDAPPALLTYLLSIGIVMGAFALYSSAYRAPRLSEHLCREALSRTSPDTRDRLQAGLDLARDVTGRDIILLAACTAQNDTGD